MAVNGITADDEPGDLVFAQLDSRQYLRGSRGAVGVFGGGQGGEACGQAGSLLQESAAAGRGVCALGVAGLTRVHGRDSVTCSTVAGHDDARVSFGNTVDST